MSISVCHALWRPQACNYWQLSQRGRSAMGGMGMGIGGRDVSRVRKMGTKCHALQWIKISHLRMVDRHVRAGGHHMLDMQRRVTRGSV